MSAAMVVNPAAGRGRGKQTAEKLKNYFREIGADVQFFYSRRPGGVGGQAVRAARQHPVVAAVGGDGTVHEILQVLQQTKCVLGIVPGGTGNDYARGLGIPLHWRGAASVLMGGNTIRMDLGCTKQACFGALAAVGFTADVMAEVSGGGSLSGPAAIAAAVWKSLRHLSFALIRLTIDGDSRQLLVNTVLIMNMAYGGGGMRFSPYSRCNDGQLTVVIIKPSSKPRLLANLPRVYFGRHINHPLVEVISGSRIRIEGERLPTVFDGELRGNLPLDCSIIPQSMPVLVPKHRVCNATESAAYS